MKKNNEICILEPEYFFLEMGKQDLKNDLKGGTLFPIEENTVLNGETFYIFSNVIINTEVFCDLVLGMYKKRNITLFG